jgi:tetratricopeptide (TPR) repeat protein
MKIYPSLILHALIFGSSSAFSQDRTALKEYADSLYMVDKYEMARKAYDAFIAHDSSNAQAFHRRGTSYLEADMLALAERDLRKATELDSLYANSYYNLGLIQNRQDRSPLLP